MNAEPLVTRSGNRPVHPPFKQCWGLIARKRLEGRFTIDKELSLRMKPTPYVSWRTNFDVKIRKLRHDLARMIGIQRVNRVGNITHIGLDPKPQGSGL